jgi:hypothetical protein
MLTYLKWTQVTALGQIVGHKSWTQNKLKPAEIIQMIDEQDSSTSKKSQHKKVFEEE